MTIRNADLIGALASLVASAITDEGKLSLGHTGERSVIHVTHQEDRHEAILRTDNGEAWVMRVAPLGKNLSYDGSDDAAKVRASYKRYEELVDSKNHALRYAKSLGIDDENLALQTFYEEVLNDKEREIWDLWSPGGHASSAELLIATGVSRRVGDGTGLGLGLPQTPPGGLPRYDADEMS